MKLEVVSKNEATLNIHCSVLFPSAMMSEYSEAIAEVFREYFLRHDAKIN